MNESDLSAARGLLSPAGQAVACMLPIAPDLASGVDITSAAASNWDALVSELPRQGLFVVRCKVEQASAQPADASAAADTRGEEGPVVGVVSVRYNTNANGSGSNAGVAERSSPVVHMIDCLVCSTALAKM